MQNTKWTDTRRIMQQHPVAWKKWYNISIEMVEFEVKSTRPDYH